MVSPAKRAVMVTLSHPGRVGEARGDEAGAGLTRARGRAEAGGTRARVGRAEAGWIRARVGEALGDEAGAGLTRARRDRARRDEADPVHLRAPERGDAVP